MNKKIIICTGGSGGHVIPAINFGNYLFDKGFDCFLFVDQRGKRYSEQFKGKIYIIHSSHLSGNIFFKFKYLIKLLIGFFQSLIIICKIRPNKCISFGSYAAFMPLLSTLFLKLLIKTDIYIHEQNSIIGKVNLFFLPYAKIIFTNFIYLKNIKKKYKNNILYVGWPSNSKFNLNFSKINNLKETKTILIYGGSQGSIQLINNFLLMCKNLDKNYFNKIKIIIQSPKELYDKLYHFFNNLKIDFEIKEFYRNIDEILSITDIAITRAGAGTINDLIKYKIPSIIIPLPHAIYNHQFYNAKYLFDINGSILMDEKNFNIDINTEIFKKLISDSKQQEIMKNALNTIILPDANKIMLTKIAL